MKHFKILTISVPVFLLVLLTGCLKTHDNFTDFSKTSDFVILQNAGLANFGSVAFNRGSDTVNLTVRVDLASSTNPSSSTTATIAVDPSLIAPYNTANPQPGYIVLPSANYKLMATTLTIPAGQHYAETTLQVYTKGLDPAVSYMLPISLKDASGKALSSNLNSIYFHTIGNPLAGAYSYTFYRWNGTSDTTGAANGGITGPTVVNVSPTGPTSLLFPDIYLNTFVNAASGSTLSFTNTNGVLSNFVAGFTDQQKKDVEDPAGAFGGLVLTAPTLVGYQIVGNASTKYVGSTFRFYISVKNSSGGIRTFIDQFVKQ